MIDFLSFVAFPPPFPHFLSLSSPLSFPLSHLSRILFYLSIRKKSSLALIIVLRKSRLHVALNTNIQFFLVTRSWNLKEQDENVCTVQPAIKLYGRYFSSPCRSYNFHVHAADIYTLLF